MNTDTSAISHIRACSLPDALLGGISINGLAYLKTHPESPLLEKVEAVCSKCGEPLGLVERLWSNLCACERCRAIYFEDEAMKRNRSLWEAICPPGYRDTAKTHPDFPSVIWEKPIIRDWDGGKSLIFLGDTRTGKTRSAMLLLKRVMLQNLRIAVLWPEEVRELANARNLESVRNLALHDVIVLDDTIQASLGDDKLIEIVRQLIDMIMRNRRTFILTTQVLGDDSEAGRYGGPSPAQLKRAAALMERIREVGTLVAFPKQPKPETPF